MEGRSQQLAVDRLAGFARLDLGMFPTPLEEMPRLREELGPKCPRLFIKRDDLCGFGFGGNKVRKLEFLFAKLISDGVEVVVTTGGERSNHARLTAAVCAKLGVRCILVLDRKPRPEGTQSLDPAAVIFERLYGAEVHLVDSIDERIELAKSLVAELESDGAKAVEVPLGGASAHSVFGFVAAMREIAAQQKELGFRFDRVVFASSTAATHAGMLIGSKLFGLDGCVFSGYSPEPDSSCGITNEVTRLIDECGELLGIDTSDLILKIEIVDEFAGDGYCVNTEKADAAMDLVARTEGILLDPVYTGKAMAGLIASIEEGKVAADANVLFWHTGGQFANFFG